MNNANNQFFDFMKSFVNPEVAMNSMKQMPAMDFSTFANVIKKNAEVLTTTNQMAAESMQSIVRRGAEVFQNNASQMFNAVKDVVSAGDLEQAAACQQNYMKSILENSVNNAKEIMDMSSKSSMEIFEAMGKSMAENMNKAFQHHNQKSK
jgi:phasin family protein